MPRHAISAAVAVTGLLAVAAPAAARPVVDRVQVGGVRDQPATRGFSHSLAMTIVAPRGYRRGGGGYDGRSGSWLGPDFTGTANHTFTGPSSITWGVRFVRGHKLARLAAREEHDYPRAARGNSRIRHVVAHRRAGTLRAAWVLDGERSPGARVDGTLAVALGKGAVALVTFYALDPPVDDAGSPGRVKVRGRSADAWNRAQVRAALSKVYLEGNLPPQRVRTRVRGRRMTGSLLDGYGQPVSLTPVRLLAGRHTVATATTNARGRFRLSVPRRGRYRVAGTLGGFTAQSRAVKVR